MVLKITALAKKKVCVCVCVYKSKGFLTSMRKSPVLSPALHATPSRSTDSRYCRAGKAGVGVNSSMGVSANKKEHLITVFVCECYSSKHACMRVCFRPLAPRSTKPNPSLSLFCNVALFSSIT